MKIVILAAGRGSRLGGEGPKPLTVLANGSTILALQLRNVARCADLDDVRLVVGHKREAIAAAFPRVRSVYNPAYASENTAKSLLRAIGDVDDDVLWMNGDVVFSPGVLEHVLAAGVTCMAVNNDRVAEEEVKYRCDGSGRIIEVSKEVEGALGEAVGINVVRRPDLARFKRDLARCAATDYFEKALQLSIDDGTDVFAADVSAFDCIEVDFPDDLERANELVRAWDRVAVG